MAAGAGHFESAFGGLLAAHVLEVDGVMLGFTQQRVAVYLQGKNPVARVHEANHIQQRLHGIDLDPADHGSLASIQFRHDQAGDLPSASFNSDR